MGMETVELVWKIEKRFDIKIRNSDAEKMTTVGEICETVIQYLPADTDRDEVIKTIIEITADHAGFEVNEIKLHHSITNDLGLD